MDTVSLQRDIFACTFGEVIGKSSREAADMDPAELVAL